MAAAFSSSVGTFFSSFLEKLSMVGFYLHIRTFIKAFGLGIMLKGGGTVAPLLKYEIHSWEFTILGGMR